jgi:hypothetical protein
LRRALASAAIIGLVATWAAAQYEPALQYQRRGDRDEGLRTVAIGGAVDIELVSARVDGPRAAAVARTASWGESIKARFFLPAPGSAYLLIRQLRSQSSFYWLSFPTRTQMELATTWAPKQTNEYVWPTLVLSRAGSVSLDNLGAVVRFREQSAGNIQEVLPVALFDRDAIETVESYRFSLRPLTKVNVTAKILREGTELFSRPRLWEDADSPFTVLWTPGAAPEGWYRLLLTGFFENNSALNREIRFYHRRALTGAVTLPAQ